MNQKYTSACTSINKTRLPAVYSRLDWSTMFEGGKNIVVDYGCGKYNNMQSVVESNGGVWYGYDKYNRTEQENAEPALLMASGFCHYIICSNVLNVVDDVATLYDISGKIQSCACPYFITVYEGDRSGVGRQTGPDSWQRNEKTREYLNLFPGAEIKHGVITNAPECVK